MDETARFCDQRDYRHCIQGAAGVAPVPPVGKVAGVAAKGWKAVKGVKTAEVAGAGAKTAEVAGRGADEAATVLKGPIADAVARNLPEQLALGAAKNGYGRQIMSNLADEPRLFAYYGEGEWVKMQYVLRGNDSNVTVHYFRNLTTKMDVEFKFP